MATRWHTTHGVRATEAPNVCVSAFLYGCFYLATSDATVAVLNEDVKF